VQTEEEEEEEDRVERGPKAGLTRSCCTFVSANLRKSLLLEFAYPNGQEFDSMTDKFYKMWLRNKFLPIRDLTKKQRKAVSFTCSFQPFGNEEAYYIYKNIHRRTLAKLPLTFEQTFSKE
jgi:hypothetical protein